MCVCIRFDPSVAYTRRDVTFRSQVHARLLVHYICQYVRSNTADHAPEDGFQSPSGLRSASQSKTASSSLAMRAINIPPRQVKARMQLWGIPIISVSVLTTSRVYDSIVTGLRSMEVSARRQRMGLTQHPANLRG